MSLCNVGKAYSRPKETNGVMRTSSDFEILPKKLPKIYQKL